MNILIASLFFPYPAVTHSGGTDLFHYIASLAERKHRVSLASYINKSEENQIANMRPHCQEIITVPEISSLVQRISKAPYLLKYPLQWVEAYSSPMRIALSEMLSSHDFDVVHFEHLWMAQYVDLVANCPVALDEVDVDSVVMYRKFQREKRLWMKPYWSWCWRKTIQLEVEACQRFHLVFTRSEKDRRYLQGLSPGCNVRELPPWFEGLEFNPQPASEVEKNSLLFVGNMGRVANIEAMEYFCQTVLPLIHAVIPDVTLYIAGDMPHERVKRLANERVVVTGYVEDLASCYARCQVFVAPMLIGGGIIVKVLDALAAGRPVVCTSIANEGIEAIPGRDLLVADSADVFAEHIIDLLTNSDLWKRIASGGRAFFEGKYHWDSIVNNLEKAYLELVSGKR